MSADIKPNASKHFHEKQIKTIYESIKTYVNKTINVHLFFTAPFPLRSTLCVCRAFFCLLFVSHIFFLSAFWLFFCLTFTRNTEQSQYSVVSRIFYARYFLPNQHEHTHTQRKWGGKGRKREHSTSIYRQNAKIKSIKQILAVRIVSVCVAVLWNYHGRLLPISEWNHVSFPLYQPGPAIDHSAAWF